MYFFCPNLQTSHMGCSTAQKYGQNPLVSSCTFLSKSSNITKGVFNSTKIWAKISSLQLNFFCPIFQTSHSRCSTAQKYGQNPLVSSCTFFVQIYSFLPINNKNLSFFPFKHHKEGGQQHKNMGKILQSLAVLFCPNLHFPPDEH